jgi:hypothetical protein
MDLSAAADALMRRKLLEDIYERMSEDEKKLFVRMTMERKDSGEILKALEQQSRQIADLKRHQQTFGEVFASNIAGNAAWDGTLWLVGRLARLMRS